MSLTHLVETQNQHKNYLKNIIAANKLINKAEIDLNQKIVDTYLEIEKKKQELDDVIDNYRNIITNILSP